MSDKTIPTVALVIDASIARSAGGYETTHPVGRNCRDFLQKVRGIGHRIVMGSTLRAEWMKHRSGFAMTWLVSMTKINKVVTINDSIPDDLKATIESVALPDSVRGEVLKDAHLVVAAGTADNRVASSDRKIRKYLARHFSHIERIAILFWVNPTVPEEEAIVWLQNGAPDEDHRRLKNHV